MIFFDLNIQCFLCQRLVMSEPRRTKIEWWSGHRFAGPNFVAKSMLMERNVRNLWLPAVGVYLSNNFCDRETSKTVVT